MWSWTAAVWPGPQQLLGGDRRRSFRFPTGDAPFQHRAGPPNAAAVHRFDCGAGGMAAVVIVIGVPVTAMR